jgi:hypothetical protein
MLVPLVSAGTADAAATLTFDELPFQSVEGLSYKAVTFGFSVAGSPSSDAYYNAIGPGTLTYVKGKTLEGNARGILTLDFATPTDMLEFGIAFNTRSPVSEAYTVELFDQSLTLIGTLNNDTNPLVYWSEGKFSYYGMPISRAVVDFNQCYARRFAMDNLATNTIPAPGAVLLGSLGAGCVGWLRRRRTL